MTEIIVQATLIAKVGRIKLVPLSNRCVTIKYEIILQRVLWILQPKIPFHATSCKKITINNNDLLKSCPIYFLA